MADVIQIKPQARVRLQKNTGDVLYDQEFAPAASTYTSHVVQAITLATNTSVTLDQGNIVAVRNLLVQADNAVTIKVNGQVTTGLPLVGTNSVYCLFSTSVTAFKVVNASTTNTATVNYVFSN